MSLKVYIKKKKIKVLIFGFLFLRNQKKPHFQKTVVLFPKDGQCWPKMR